MEGLSYLPRIDNHGRILQDPHYPTYREAHLVGEGRPGKVWIQKIDAEDEEAQWSHVTLYTEFVLGGIAYKVGAYIYVSPECEGDWCEIARIEQIYDNGMPGDDNICLTIRWMWRPEMLTLKKKDEKLFAKLERDILVGHHRQRERG